MGKQPRFVLPQFSSLSESYVVGSSCRFVDWSSGSIARTRSGWCLHVEERNQHDRWLSCFLCSQRRRRLSLTALSLSFRVVLKKFHVSSSMKTLDDVPTHLHTMLLQIISFSINFPQTFNKPNLRGESSKLRCFFYPSDLWSFEQLNQRSPHNTYLTHSMLTWVRLIEGLLLQESFFLPPYTSLWASWTTQKHVCDMLLSPYTCWSISSARDGIFPNWSKNCRLICSALLKAERFGKEKT